MDTPHQSVNIIFTHIPQETHKAFDILADQKWISENEWYLAGGTALTLQSDHRVSYDLDFFTPQKDFDSESINIALLPYQWAITRNEKGTLYGELQGAKVSFIAYPYFVAKQPYILYKTIHILDIRDIAVMKIIAISQRGRKRDFFDLYWYLQYKESLINILKRVNTQYPKLAHNYHHIFKSLTYFEEAEEDPEPQIFFEATWEQVKKYFLITVPGVAEKFL